MSIPDARRLTEIRERLALAECTQLGKSPKDIEFEAESLYSSGWLEGPPQLYAHAPADIRDLLERVEKLEADLDVANDALKTAAVLLKGKN